MDGLSPDFKNLLHQHKISENDPLIVILQWYSSQTNQNGKTILEAYDQIKKHSEEFSQKIDQQIIQPIKKLEDTLQTSQKLISEPHQKIAEKLEEQIHTPLQQCITTLQQFSNLLSELKRKTKQIDPSSKTRLMIAAGLAGFLGGILTAIYFSHSGIPFLMPQ